MVGPSFPLALILEEVKSKIPSNSYVADPFPGTYLTEKVLNDSKANIPVYPSSAVEKGEGDAYSVKFKNKTHLLIIDANYSDIPNYIKTVIAPGFASIPFPEWTIIQAGDVWDQSWCKAVEDALEKTFPRGTQVWSHSVGFARFVCATRTKRGELVQALKSAGERAGDGARASRPK